MKKTIIFIFLILIGLYFINNKEYDLTKDTIRFRVIANSDSPKDILMKEKVVNNLSTILFNGNNSINNTRKNIINNLSNVENIIEKTFKENNYKKTFNINYGNNYFPKKEYNKKTLASGEYESLVVTIGEGKGSNYWCILYPPLCMTSENKNSKIKFKIVELINNIF